MLVRDLTAEMAAGYGGPGPGRLLVDAYQPVAQRR
jgi:hypothetical protein